MSLRDYILQLMWKICTAKVICVVLNHCVLFNLLIYVFGFLLYLHYHWILLCDVCFRFWENIFLQHDGNKTSLAPLYFVLFICCFFCVFFSSFMVFEKKWHKKILNGRHEMHFQFIKNLPPFDCICWFIGKERKWRFLFLLSILCTMMFTIASRSHKPKLYL